MSSSDRIPELDGLRGLAILLVMSFHFFWFPNLNGFFPAVENPLLKWLVALQVSGWCGVDLFFTLSGYLITGILADGREGTGFFRNFYVRRVLRIFPAYYLLLLLWPLLARFYPHYAQVAAAADYPVWLWTYTTNFLLTNQGWGAAPLPLRHLWSLAIEEQFYLLWPLAIDLLTRRRAMVLCLVLMIAAPWLRLELLHWYAPLGAGYLMMPARMDSLAAGSLVALMQREGLLAGARKGWLRIALLATGGAVVLLFVARGGLRGEDALVSTLGLTALALLFASLIGHLATAPAKAWLRQAFGNRMLRWFGQYSYGLYLWHQPAYVLVFSSGLFGILRRAYAPHTLWLLVVLCYALPLMLTIAVALVSWYVLEQPLLRYKQRFSSR